MTYCLALCLDQGLVFASDSRSNAGSDYVTTYGKTHVFDLGPDRLFVILTAGNLATTQEVINRLRRGVDGAHSRPGAGAGPGDGGDEQPSLATARYLFEAADLVGGLSLEVQEHHERGLNRGGVNGSATMILGGQIRGEPPGIYLIYPEGNAISASEETPYLQIGESKYGKPILDRLAHSAMSLADGARLALVSLDATARSNATVDMPFDVTLYQRDGYAVTAAQRFGRESEAYRMLNETWNQGLDRTFRSLAETLPPSDWHLS